MNALRAPEYGKHAFGDQVSGMTSRKRQKIVDLANLKSSKKEVYY